MRDARALAEKITCREQEDWTAYDDIVLKVNGETVDFRSMKEGTTDTLDEYVTFTGKAVIKLYEADYGPGDSDDLLGEHTVTGGSGVLEFTRDDAHYHLSYEVNQARESGPTCRGGGWGRGYACWAAAGARSVVAIVAEPTTRVPS
ncbi:hypothetical protein [Streptomyces sp. NPDC005322]|uniref:hypothetical protein n=1 Tax=unclassified Streptomyces TaxID=2593676 RepID=UPI0033ACDFE5